MCFILLLSLHLISMFVLCLFYVLTICFSSICLFYVRFPILNRIVLCAIVSSSRTIKLLPVNTNGHLITFAYAFI